MKENAVLKKIYCKWEADGQRKAVALKETTSKGLTRENYLVYTVCDGCCHWQLSCNAQAASI